MNILLFENDVIVVVVVIITIINTLHLPCLILLFLPLCLEDKMHTVQVLLMCIY